MVRCEADGPLCRVAGTACPETAGDGKVKVKGGEENTV